MKHRCLPLVLAFLVLCSPVLAQRIRTNPLPPPVPFERDSGLVSNPFGEARTIHVEPVLVPGAAWLRLYFGATRLEEGSYLRITSELDSEVQELDAEGLAMWNNTSAYFNGDAVVVELIGGAHTQENQLVIAQLASEALPQSPDTLCGADDRVLSSENWAGKVEPNGCSAAVWNEQGCLISAGHCYDSPSDAQVIEFRVPLNAGNCSQQHPPVADQFPILARLWSDAGVGNDWAVSTTGTNNLGQTIFDRFGEIRPIALSIPGVGESVQIWGYGVDSDCLLSGVQQFSEGQVTALGSDWVAHNADTQGGNSGSGVIHDGEIIAAHTHGGCPQNRGTRIDDAPFANARATLCIPEAGSVGLERDLYRCRDTMTIKLEDGSVVGSGSQQVVVASPTEPAGETVTLTELYAGVFSATFSTGDAVPAVTGDGAVSVVHDDTISVTYADADDGSGTGGPVVATATTDCLGPAISGVQISAITTDQAAISWSTDEASSSGASAFGSAGSAAESSEELVTSHDLVLSGLTGCAQYAVTVSSTDLAGNVTVDNNGGAFYSLITACPSVPGVPDGSQGSEPMTARLVTSNSIEVHWDNSCFSSGPTKIIYGPLNGVASYGIFGSVCNISATVDSKLWQNVFLGNLWFLVVKDNAFEIEGSWGQATSGERGGTQPSGQCDVVDKDVSGICP